MISAISSTSGISPIGLQVWSIAKFLQQDFSGSLKLLSQIGYKQLELFGPYPFSSQKDIDEFKAISPQLGFSQSGYFNHSPKEFRKILDDNGLTTPAMHVGLDTLRHKLGELAEAAHILGLPALPRYQRRSDKRSTTINAWLMNSTGLEKRQKNLAFDSIITITAMDCKRSRVKFPLT